MHIPIRNTARLRSTAAVPAAGVLALALAGCSMFGGDDEGGEGGEAADQAQPVNAGKVEPGDADARETIASQDVSTLETDLHVALHSLARGGETVELTFSVTNIGDSESDIISNTFSPGGDRDVSGVKLVDSDNGKVHLVARDADDACVCSGGLRFLALEPDDSILLSATYGAPPSEVETLDVKIPRVGTFDNVPLS
ncbi:fimbrial protein [Nocardiopsis baichengensis]|uniref:hypothetical protein n=1 Tax=Nocardiopsis baichengensis TaxID=280240 RepID=UPI0003459B5F|nr:hypothetical protein [Nocardiopsis baichengensis]